MPIVVYARPTTPKMPLFQRAVYGPDPSFAPLAQMLSNWEQAAREIQQANACHPAQQQRRHHVRPSFVPNFDVIETETDYQLHGELGGITKKDVKIEFTDEHTLVVRGRVEKTYKTSNTNAEQAPEASTTEPSEKAAVTNEPEVATTPEAEAFDEDEDITASTIIDAPTDGNSHKVTVRDEEDEERAENGEPSATEEKKDSAAIEALQQEQLEQQLKQKREQCRQRCQRQQRPAYKYWLSERSAGDFTRVFKFPGRVEREGVTAALENGILSVTVPKAKKLEARNITIA